MKLEDAVNASQIWAARGYDENGKCVVSIAYYGEKLMWLTGFGGNWAKGWEVMSDEDKESIKNLDFRPFGAKPEDQIEEEIKEAITEIIKDEDDFEPIGEADYIV